MSNYSILHLVLSLTRLVGEHPVMPHDDTPPLTDADLDMGAEEALGPVRNPLEGIEQMERRITLHEMELRAVTDDDQRREITAQLQAARRRLADYRTAHGQRN